MGAGPAYIVLAYGQTAEGPSAYIANLSLIKALWLLIGVTGPRRRGTAEDSFVDAGASKKWAV